VQVQPDGMLRRCNVLLLLLLLLLLLVPWCRRVERTGNGQRQLGGQDSLGGRRGRQGHAWPGPFPSLLVNSRSKLKRGREREGKKGPRKRRTCYKNRGLSQMKMPGCLDVLFGVGSAGRFCNAPSSAEVESSAVDHLAVDLLAMAAAAHIYYYTPSNWYGRHRNELLASVPE
jgi:hypothetical protein